MNNKTYTLRFELSKTNCAAMNYISNVLTKLLSFDMSLIENGSFDIDVDHTYSIVTNKKTIIFSVDVYIKNNGLLLIPEKDIEIIYDYLNNSRTVIIDEIFSSKDKKDIDDAVIKINKFSSTLNGERNLCFESNTSRILRNVLDLATTKNNKVTKIDYIIKSNDFKEKRFEIKPSNNLKSIITVCDQNFSEEPIDRSLTVYRPNFINKTGKWEFKFLEKTESYYIKDEAYIDKLFNQGDPSLTPGCTLVVTMDKGNVGRGGKSEYYISKVLDIKRPMKQQLELPLRT